MRPRLSFLLLALALFALGGVLSWPRPAALPTSAPKRTGPVPEMGVVVAARDIDYCAPRTPCGPGSRTDTIFYVRVRGGEAVGVAIPRDLYSPLVGGKINAAYGRGGPELLKRAVEEATGLVAERHLIFTLEGVARVVDAVGGVEVYLDRPMRYVDRAANLYIDFPAGRLHLSGEEAVKYMRFRHDALGDYARLDRIKAVATQVARKAQDYLPYARGFQVALATLPTREGAGTYLYVDEARRGELLAALFGGPPLAPPPGLPVRLRGDAGLIAWGRAFLEREGVEVRTEEAEVARSAVYASDPAVGRYYAGLFHLPVIAPHRSLAEVVVELGPDLLH